jgi:hypothetical protein
MCMVEPESEDALWREAVTYRETAPHEYVVRKWEVDEQGNRDFDRFVILIRRFGYADCTPSAPVGPNRLIV